MIATLLATIINAAVLRRHWLMLVALLITAIGVFSFQQLRIDAVPDITNVQVQINTEAPGYTPEEVEQRLTRVVETVLSGLPQMAYSRSISRYGLSQVTVVFDDNTDLYFARNQVSERLTVLQSQLPAGVQPKLAPMATGLGEIVTYQLRAKPGAGKPMDLLTLRETQDWLVKPQLSQVPGVVEVNTIGGEQRQYQVLLQPERLLTFGLTLDDVVLALQRSNRQQGAGFIEQNGRQLLVRSSGQLSGHQAIADVVVSTVSGSPVTVADVAQVISTGALRTGAATVNGEQAVLGTVMMQVGANAKTVATATVAKLTDINASLPDGMELVVLYNRSHLVDAAIVTVRNNLLEGAVLVMVVLMVLLGNWRAALLTAMVIPLSMLLTVTGMVYFGLSANLMSLGALDFGLIVDGAVIIVENCVRRLTLASQRGPLSQQARLTLVYQAAREVSLPSVFGVAIITLVYLPIFALTGVEGKLFQPMALTVVIALLAALALSLTLVPAAVALWVKVPVASVAAEPTDNNLADNNQTDSQETGTKENHSRAASDGHPEPLRWLADGYRWLLQWTIRLRLMVFSAGLITVGACMVLATKLGAEFTPLLDEGDIALHTMRVNGTSLTQSLAMQTQLEQTLLAFAEVDQVFAKIGTAEVATDPMPPSVADNIVLLKPREQWPNPALSKPELLAKLQHALLPLPGNNYEFTQPIQMRFNELLSGVRADVAVKVYGDDLAQLQQLAEQVLAVTLQVSGAQDARIEAVAGQPVLTLQPDAIAIARYGLSIEAVQGYVAALVTGAPSGVLYQGERQFDIVSKFAVNDAAQQLKLGANLADDWQYLPIALPDDVAARLGVRFVPLSELATWVTVTTPSQISREQGKRRLAVTVNVRGRDLASFVDELQAKLNRQLSLPAGYWLDYGGSFEQLQSASRRLALVVPVTLLLIVLVLVMAVQSLKDALLIFSAVPMALTGGVVALWLRDMPLSISAGVGFIALSGVAVLNGLVMLSFIQQQRQLYPQPLMTAIVNGAVARLRPVLMTALVASLGFVPMALNMGIGAEVQRPVATVVIGGIVSATLLTLLILPALCFTAYRKAPQSAFANNEENRLAQNA